MKFLTRVVVALMLACFLAAVVHAESRTWTSANGQFQTKAEFVRLKAGDLVVLKREADAKEIDVPLAQLSEADQAYLRSKGIIASAPVAAPTAPPVASIATPASTDAAVRAVEREANAAKTAEEAVLLYTIFLSDPSLPAGVRQSAMQNLDAWNRKAEQGLVRNGTKWVTLEEARAGRIKADFLIQQALEMIKSNQDQIAIEKLQEASVVAPNEIMADFLLGIGYAVAMNRFDKAATHFNKCLIREPMNPVVLNNLALTQIRLRRPDEALKHWRSAASVCRDERIVQNIGRLFEMSGRQNRQIKIPDLVLRQLSDIYADLVVAQGVKSGASKTGWQYMVLPQRAPLDETDLELPADPSATPAMTVCADGFVVAPQYILTTRSATRGLTGFVIADPTVKGKKLAAKLVASSKEADLSLLHCPDLQAPVAPLDMNPPRFNLPIVAAGYPAADTMATSLKAVRGSTRTPASFSQLRLVVYDAPKAPSIVGGPVVDDMGNVVAMHWKTPTFSNNYCAGIPIGTCLAFVENALPSRPSSKVGRIDLPPGEVEKQAAKYTVVVLAQSPSQDTGLRSRVGEECYTDISCCRCNGSHAMDCPDNQCNNGKKYVERSVLTGVTPTGVRTFEIVRDPVPCGTCGGVGKVPCINCAGSGIDPTIITRSPQRILGN